MTSVPVGNMRGRGAGGGNAGNGQQTGGKREIVTRWNPVNASSSLVRLWHVSDLMREGDQVNSHDGPARPRGEREIFLGRVYRGGVRSSLAPGYCHVIPTGFQFGSLRSQEANDLAQRWRPLCGFGMAQRHGGAGGEATAGFPPLPEGKG